VAIGPLARAALERSGRFATPLAELPDAPYYEANSEILWVGAHLPAMHPRAVVTASPVPRGCSVYFDPLPSSSCAPRAPRLEQTSWRLVIEGVKKLRDAVLSSPPRGLGELLAGRSPAFPLDFATPRVQTLARAYAANDADAVCDASASLLGVGNGLTPSGDDLAGAALYARQFIAPCDVRWKIVAERLADRVTRRSNRISAALFRDLVYGRSFAPLHAMAEALAVGHDSDALSAARVLLKIGHSSGWDMLMGLIIGLVGDDFGSGSTSGAIR
jgi:Protein of unknown function (DUF2877)